MSCRSRRAGDLVAGAARAADVDREPQRVPGVDARAPGDLARRGRRGPGSRGSRRASPPATASVSASSSGPCTAAWRRAASSEAVSSALGLVDSVSVTAAVDDRPRRSSRSGRGGGSPTGSGCRRACAPSRGRRRHPHARALAGSSAENAQVGAPGFVDDSGRSRRGRPRQPGDVGDRAEVGGRDGQAPRRRRAGRSSAVVERLRRQAVGDAELGVELGCDEGGLQPGEDDPVDVLEEWTLRWTTTPRPTWRSARQAAWLPCEAPLTRNQLRRAPHASAASRWACWNGLSRGPTSMPSIPAGMSRSNARLAERLAAAPGPLRSRLCARGRGSARDCVRRARRARRDRESGPGPSVRHARQASGAGAVRSVPRLGLDSRPRSRPRALATFGRPRWTTTVLLEVPGHTPPVRRATSRSRPAYDRRSSSSLLVAARAPQRDVRRRRVRARARRGARGSRRWPRRAARADRCSCSSTASTRYLSACQVGITMASIGIGFLGEPAIACLIEPVLRRTRPHGVATAISRGDRLHDRHLAPHRDRRAGAEDAWRSPGRSATALLLARPLDCVPRR